MFTTNGKQVLNGSMHVCDAVNATTAQTIADALNWYFDQTAGEVDDDHPDLFDAQNPLPAPVGTHYRRREGDEYVCSCGKRWGTDEGEDHP